MADNSTMCDETVSVPLDDPEVGCDVCWCEDARGHAHQHRCGTCGGYWHSLATLRGARVELSG